MDRNMVQGPIMNLWRACTDNDLGSRLQNRSSDWRQAAIKAKVVKANAVQLQAGQIQVNFTFSIPNNDEKEIAQFKSTYLIDRDGKIKLTHQFKKNTPDLAELPRMGVNLILPSEYSNVEYYGRGPWENYIDRKTAAFVDVYKAKVADFYVPYIRPQENGNRTDVRWASFTNEAGNGILIKAVDKIEFGAHHNLNQDFEWKNPLNIQSQADQSDVVNFHTTDIKPRKLVSVNIDFMQMGVGGDNTWGARTHEKYRMHNTEYEYSYYLIPIKTEE